MDVAASCSLLHVPLDVTLDTDLDTEIAGWLSFARQKLDEIVTLRRGLTEGHGAIANTLHINTARLTSRSASPIVRVPAVRERVPSIEEIIGHLNTATAAFPVDRLWGQPRLRTQDPRLPRGARHPHQPGRSHPAAQGSQVTSQTTSPR